MRPFFKKYIGRVRGLIPKMFLASKIGIKSKLLVYSKYVHLQMNKIVVIHVPVGKTNYQIKGKVKRIKRKSNPFNFGYKLERKISGEILQVTSSKPLI